MLLLLLLLPPLNLLCGRGAGAAGIRPRLLQLLRTRPRLLWHGFMLHTMKVILEFLAPPRINGSVKGCIRALLDPVPHVLKIRKLSSIEEVLLFQPLQATQPADLTL